jgi:hypothetical protein
VSDISHNFVKRIIGHNVDSSGDHQVVESVNQRRSSVITTTPAWPGCCTWLFRCPFIVAPFEARVRTVSPFCGV